MKKIRLIIAVLLMIAASAYAYWLFVNSTYVYWLFPNSWRESTGFITGRNTIYMNAPSGTRLFAGYGQLTIDEGKHIHVEYALDSGNFDLAFQVYAEGNDDLAVESLVFKNLQNSGEIFGKSGVSGKGTLDFDVVPDTYEVHFRPHDVVGSATVTEKAN